jgi:predicted Zn-dependent protease
MAAVVLEETPRDSDRATQALLDAIGGKLAAVVRNRLHRFEITEIETDRPTAFALPGGFIFIARSLVQLCNRDKDDIAFVLAHEMAHVIRRTRSSDRSSRWSSSLMMVSQAEASPPGFADRVQGWRAYSR